MNPPCLPFLPSLLPSPARCPRSSLSQSRAQILIELLIPELWDPVSGSVMQNDGDQMRMWSLSRMFVEHFAFYSGIERVR